MMTTNHTYTLNNGLAIPAIGFGTFRTPSGQETEQSVIDAIAAGYRLIDGAAIYQNERSVGDAIRKSGVSREELFITSKLWNTNKGYEETLAAFNQTLSDLQLEYLDLYLIHWPVAKDSRDRWKEANAETWRAFEELHRQGKIKSLGVSNFLPHHLDALLATATIKPTVNQIELHPGFPQEEVVNYCKEHNIIVEAWAPFAAGHLMNHSEVVRIADKYQKTTAQICLRWIIQKGIVPLPKSVTPERITANLQVFDFEISAEDARVLDQITHDGGSGAHPDHIDF